VTQTTTVADAWRGEPITLPDVDRSLERQYRDARRNGESGLVRTRVATLVIITPDEAHAREALETVGKLTGRNPSRCIVLIVQPTDAAAPEQGVRAWAKVTRRGKGVQGLRDEVVVEAAIPPDHLASVVLPLLLPDIPVFTWWTGTIPLDRDMGRELLSVTDRLIVDSATFADPIADLTTFAEAGAGLPAPSDCVWGRLTPWRELLAGSFDALPGGAHPHQLTTLRLATVTPTAGLLLAGWLTTRLGWEPVSVEAGGSPGTGIGRFRRPDGAEATIEILPAAGSNALASLRAEAASDSGPVTIQIDARGRLLLASQHGGRGLAQTRVTHAGISVAEVLTEELEVFSRDRVYQEALTATSAWTRAQRA
jgi:glucose-6-phosphate dehydrogenase assembly protein OpcA